MDLSTKNRAETVYCHNKLELKTSDIFVIFKEYILYKKIKSIKQTISTRNIKRKTISLNLRLL